MREQGLRLRRELRGRLAGLRPQAKPPLQPLDDAVPFCVASADGFEDVETVGNGADRADTELAGAARDFALFIPPDEHRTSLRIHGDVEAVLGTIVDDHVQSERFGDLPARAVDDEY